MQNSNKFNGVGDIQKITFSRGKDGNCCFLSILVDVPEEEGSYLQKAIVFDQNRSVWSKLESLTQGMCVEVEGFLHGRKQSLPGFKNDKGENAFYWFSQLVIQKMDIIGEDEE